MFEILSMQLVQIRSTMLPKACVFSSTSGIRFFEKESHNTEEHVLEAVKVHQFPSGELKSPTSNRLPSALALRELMKFIILVK